MNFATLEEVCKHWSLFEETQNVGNVLSWLVEFWHTILNPIKRQLQKKNEQQYFYIQK